MPEHGLQRFVSAHRQDYERALGEIRSGRKVSHWMWYIFPQLYGLGRSDVSQYYGIQGLEEAAAFLEDPYLAENLLQICDALLRLETNNARLVFGRPDDMKLRSSMTLFAVAAGEGSVFHRVLDKFFGGCPDRRTLGMLGID